MKLNLLSIFSLLGLLLLLNGGFILLCIPVSVYFNEPVWLDLLISGAITVSVGAFAYLTFKPKVKTDINKREGYLVVTLGWVLLSLSGSLPYLVSGEIASFSDAFFETMSGYTTTGASILTDIESMSRGLLVWRSLTHWIGGMGIIVLTVAILPLLGIGGMQLFIAEAPGLTPDKLKPRITDTAKRLWLIYFGLTALQTILLKLGGMSLFDAVNHSMATMATGGFSTKQDSIAYYTSPFIHYINLLYSCF
ncbi:MAG: potassium transporter TrkG [Cyclobacteriaceae bacterium]|nr:potassium transporter TrkG [Cyclobacteriaceae bacterium]